MQSSMLRAIVEDFGNGGTIDGDLTISGDLTVSGGGSLSFDEILEGTQVIDVTDPKAFLVRKDGDGGNVFVVDSTNSRVGIGTDSPQDLLHIQRDSTHQSTLPLPLMRLGITDVAGNDMYAGEGPAIEFRVGENTEIESEDVSGLIAVVKEDNGDGVTAAAMTFWTGADQADATEKMRITSAGLVGIGATAPTDYDAGADNLVVYDSVNAGISIIAGTSGTSAIHFGDGTSAASYRGYINYSHGSDAFTFATGAAARMTIDSSGNVGIGTAVPSSKMEIQDTLSSDTQSTPETLLILGAKYSDSVGTNGAAGSGTMLQFEIPSDDTNPITGTAIAGLKENADDGINNAAMAFYISQDDTTLDEAMRIDSAGNVGIGTSSPDTELEIVDISGDTELTLSTYSATASHGSKINLRRSKGTTDGSPVATADDDVIGEIAFYGVTTAPAFDLSARILVTADGTPDSNEQAVDMGFYTTYAAGVPELRLLLDANSRISLSNNDAGADNTVFGYLAGAGILEGGDQNVLIGDGSGQAVSTSDNNVSIGYDALNENQTGGNNIAIGSRALNKITTADNTAIGHHAARFNETGTDNTYLGNLAGQGVSGQSNSNNVGVGSNALLAVTTGGDNIAIGAYAGDAMTDNDGNVVIGKSAFSTANTGEDYNVVIGGDAGTAIDDANSESNVLIGQDAGTGGAAAMIGCIAIGRRSMKSTAANAQTGTIAIGHDALTALTSGAGNVAVGYQSLMTEDAHGKNTAVGYEALKILNAGQHGFNTAVGHQAGNVITSGIQNTIIGSDSDASANSGLNQTVVGYATTGQADNSVTLGNDDVTAVYMASDKGATVRADNAKIVCQGVEFPDTQSASGDANILDDYEEGTWTAGINGGSAVSLTLDVTSGFYTKIGNVVHCTAEIRVTGLNSAAGSSYVTGLPFASRALGGTNLGKGPNGGIVTLAENLNITAGQSVNISVEAGASIAYLTLWDDDAGLTPLSPAEISADGELYITFSYLT